ncbi:hypothetical protein CGMCC3_g858 [Colletotrichum fructicola]|nr:uncharacterized protein CGMCC3_g858 [Colletotrichum fructicola]KAE9583327.1 hypothetical protein CGMCC3_g858 [Colletotrichum fructicola]
MINQEAVHRSGRGEWYSEPAPRSSKPWTRARGEKRPIKGPPLCLYDVDAIFRSILPSQSTAAGAKKIIFQRHQRGPRVL